MKQARAGVAGAHNTVLSDIRRPGATPWGAPATPRDLGERRDSAGAGESWKGWLGAAVGPSHCGPAANRRACFHKLYCSISRKVTGINNIQQSTLIGKEDFPISLLNFS